MYVGVESFSATPRVSVADVENSIGTSLPLGTPRNDVEAWLTIRSMRSHVSKDEAGHTIIESWIPDSGPRAEWPYGIRDIRIQFIFGENGQLVKFTVREEDRF